MTGPFQTERLTLRLTDESDAPFIQELVNTPQWLEYIGDREVRSEEDAARYIREMMLPQVRRLGYGNYTVLLTADGTRIGTCGLYDRKGMDFPDLGFAYLPKFHRRGYGLEAAQKLIELAFTHLDYERILAITVPENIGSQRLLERLGFAREGTVRLPKDEVELLRYALDR